MEIDKNDTPRIDVAFRKAMLAAEEADDGLALWESSLARNVVRQNFFKFGFTHFNVFTASLMASVALVVISATYYTVKPSAPFRPKEKGDARVELLGDSSTGASPSQWTEDNNPVEHTETGNTDLYAKEGNSSDAIEDELLSADSAVVPLEIKAENIPEEILPAKNVHENKVIPVKIVKRTVHIEKRDTVETVDTIRSKKEWRKAVKNK